MNSTMWGLSLLKKKKSNWFFFSFFLPAQLGHLFPEATSADINSDWKDLAGLSCENWPFFLVLQCLYVACTQHMERIYPLHINSAALKRRTFLKEWKGEDWRKFYFKTEKNWYAECIQEVRSATKDIFLWISCEKKTNKKQVNQVIMN